MAEIRYGLREGPGKGREYPVAASQYMHRRGGHFVFLNGAGHASTCATGTAKVMGWAETPKDASGKNSWKSSSTAGADKVFIITGLENAFEIPADEAKASVNATRIGKGAKIIESGATYAKIQKAKSGCGDAASPLSIVDFDSTNKTYFVKIKPNALQAV
jgi:hypothetical protein